MYFFILFVTGCLMAFSIAGILGVLCLWAVLLGGVLMLNCGFINKMLANRPFWLRLVVGGLLLWAVFFAEKCSSGACDAVYISLIFTPFFVFIAIPMLLTCSMLEGVKTNRNGV